jgi:acyl carrier protein
MEKNLIKGIVNSILVDVLHHNNFKCEESLKASDVDGWDSLNHMVIITEIEEKFRIKFRLKELNKLNNLGDLFELIDIKLEE